ncbi:hypothetical protein BDB00DRAFT_876386 [Zychaea mexicana]|uniref:uncharacterized protein n=1 Tax=Zychaea mexicana TaxID=64656 RepID=UPI0022FE8651|nr:uncharacterized protein BDB00DRAFT_876386 [Zychaea mexicana]KAI9489399.1 hypothetical protein BDB00DRAFT_876386 [Zychaea mexicana]
MVFQQHPARPVGKILYRDGPPPLFEDDDTPAQPNSNSDKETLGETHAVPVQQPRHPVTPSMILASTFTEPSYNSTTLPNTPVSSVSSTNSTLSHQPYSSSSTTDSQTTYSSNTMFTVYTSASDIVSDDILIPRSGDEDQGPDNQPGQLAPAPNADLQHDARLAAITTHGSAFIPPGGPLDNKIDIIQQSQHFAYPEQQQQEEEEHQQVPENSKRERENEEGNESESDQRQETTTGHPTTKTASGSIEIAETSGDNSSNINDNDSTEIKEAGERSLKRQCRRPSSSSKQSQSDHDEPSGSRTAVQTTIPENDKTRPSGCHVMFTKFQMTGMSLQ